MFDVSSVRLIGIVGAPNVFSMTYLNMYVHTRSGTGIIESRALCRQSRHSLRNLTLSTWFLYVSKMKNNAKIVRQCCGVKTKLA